MRNVVVTRKLTTRKLATRNLATNTMDVEISGGV